jgi:hypothetical protein
MRIRSEGRHGDSTTEPLSSNQVLLEAASRPNPEGSGGALSENERKRVPYSLPMASDPK